MQLSTSLVPGGVGHTWQPGEFEQLLCDVTSRVFGVYDDGTVAAERPHLDDWRERG